MSSIRANDRVSLCLFTYTDGRRCRTPRIAAHPHFCFYHAQKEAQSQAAASLGNDLACFFSGDYLSACDLSTALSRLIPAVIRGEVKPKLARTVAYLMQTLLQSIRLSQHEYINAFSSNGWRKAIRTSVTANYDHRFPPHPDPANSDDPGPEAAADPESSGPNLCAPADLGPAAPVFSDPVEAVPLQPTNTPPTQPASPPNQPAAPAPAARTRDEEALAIARSLFPRRRRRHNNTPSTNSFSTNIYNTPA
jgi:hypothetical protein